MIIKTRTQVSYATFAELTFLISPAGAVRKGLSSSSENTGLKEAESFNTIY